MQGMKPDEMRQHFLQEARSNMPEEVRQCTSLEDMEAMLRQEEEDSIENIKETYSIPDDVWEEYMDLCTTTRDYIKNEYLTTPRPERKHSLEKEDPVYYRHVCEVFKKSGIHPDAVTILYRPPRGTATASAGSPEIDIDKTTESKITTKKEAVAYFCSLRDINPSNIPMQVTPRHNLYFAPYHEAIHLTEAHSVVFGLMRDCNRKFGNNHPFDYTEEKFLLARSQEKIAELLPLIQQKNIILVNQRIKNALSTCMKHAKQGRPIPWNERLSDDVHPDFCTELLPYLIKIKDLVQKKAVAKS
jgi:hypothetical protein